MAVEKEDIITNKIACSVYFFCSFRFINFLSSSLNYTIKYFYYRLIYSCCKNVQIKEILGLKSITKICGKILASLIIFYWSVSSSLWAL